MLRCYGADSSSGNNDAEAELVIGDKQKTISLPAHENMRRRAVRLRFGLVEVVLVLAAWAEHLNDPQIAVFPRRSSVQERGRAAAPAPDANKSSRPNASRIS
jgi:hypothetical protein